jgi:biopolymer transport protein ExbD
VSRRSISLGQADVAAFGSRKRASDGGDLDITPMIDVTFLLLIFFMVTSTMNSEKELDVPKARHGDKVESGAAIMILIRAPESGGEPRIIIDGSDGDIADVAAFVKEENAKGKKEVVIRAERNVPHGFVQRVIREANIIDELEFSFGIEDKHGS